jgi:hypothetical protein
MIDEKFVRDLILFALGAVATLVGTVLKAWLDRGTYVSKELFEKRLFRLNDLWLQLIEVRRVFWQKIPLGYDNWKTRHYDEAGQLLHKFKIEIDKAQVVLDSMTIDGFREIHKFLFASKDDGNQSPNIFMSKLSELVSDLSIKVNQTMSKRTHKIHLELKT